jgi:hypothetical protein
MKNTGPSYPGERPMLKTPTDLLTDAVRELAAQVERLTELATPIATVVATIPPRNRRVRFANGRPIDAVCFAVWSDGHITPVISTSGQLATLAVGGSDWTIVGEFE